MADFPLKVDVRGEAAASNGFTVDCIVLNELAEAIDEIPPTLVARHAAFTLLHEVKRLKAELDYWKTEPTDEC